jgi:hypothetical protein
MYWVPVPPQVQARHWRKEVKSLVLNNWPMMAAMILYAVQSYLSFKSGSLGIGVAFIFYALANVGLIIANQQGNQ